jgi:methionine-R-sulfoxide reductase
MFLRHLLPLIALISMIGCSRNTASPVTQTPDSSSSTVAVRLIGPDGKPGPVVQSPRVVKTDAAWEKQLGPEAYRVLRAKGTEAPFCGNLLDNHKDGVYFCAGCGLPLFASSSKFNSGTGWPSFYRPFAPENITELRDSSFGMVRTEILCTRCGGHLGHVFEDGPPPTGLRYCLNSAALIFKDEAEVKKMGAEAAK